jgi:hypothetical protein
MSIGVTLLAVSRFLSIVSLLCFLLALVMFGVRALLWILKGV